MKKILKGFTLTELLIVMSIIGILMTITVVGIKAAREKSKISKAKTDISNISLAVTNMYADTRTYPTCQKSLDFVTSWGGYYSIDESYIQSSDGTIPNSVKLVKDNLITTYNYPPGVTSLPATLNCAFSNWNGPYYKGSVTDPWGSKYLWDTRYANKGFTKLSPITTDYYNIVVMSMGPNKSNSFTENINKDNTCDDIVKIFKKDSTYTYNYCETDHTKPYANEVQ